MYLKSIRSLVKIEPTLGKKNEPLRHVMSEKF